MWGRGVYIGVSHAFHPKTEECQAAPILEFSVPAPFKAERPNVAWVTHIGRGVFLGGQLRHYVCTSASRGLSATAEFIVGA